MINGVKSKTHSDILKTTGLITDRKTESSSGKIEVTASIANKVTIIIDTIWLKLPVEFFAKMYIRNSITIDVNSEILVIESKLKLQLKKLLLSI